MTLWPRFCKPTAASIISRSAPPIPRSGWKKTMFFVLEDMAGLAVGEINNHNIVVRLEKMDLDQSEV